MQGNAVALELIKKYFRMFVLGNDINAEGIRLALEVEEVPRSKWSETTLKIVRFVSKALETQQDKNK